MSYDELELDTLGDRKNSFVFDYERYGQHV